MNVLHINQSDISSGAAIAGYRLHQGLLDQGIDSRLLVSNVVTNSDRVAEVPANKGISGKLLRIIAQPTSLNYIHLVGAFKISREEFYKQADLLNFHNLHTGNFNYLSIPTIATSKPAIYTLHDMWSFTGHCAYSYDCDRWKIGCGHCPYPKSYPPIERDSTQIEWKLKNWVYRRSNLTIVTPSRWLMEQAKQSMFSTFPIHYIPYGIDTEAYQPLDPEHCRALLGIPSGKKVLMFGADYLNDTRKGGDLLVKALSNLPISFKAETVLITLGNCSEALSELLGMDVLSLGYVGGDRLKAIAYSAADLFIFPTRADNLPLMLQESMACGTPMVSFKVGGVPDLVRPNITGYLASPEDAQDFCDGIMQLLEDEHLRNQMGKNCRTIALEEYPLHLQAQRYINLYQQVLQN